jgi:P27 family predicted phage terminase small subunit
MSRERVPPPGDLDAQSKRLWRKTRKALQAQHTWRDSDDELLARYVRACERARLAREAMAGELTATGSKGQNVAHPNLKTARDAERDAHDYATALLLTPESRRRHDVQVPVVGGKFGTRFGLDDPFGGRLP